MRLCLALKVNTYLESNHIVFGFNVPLVESSPMLYASDLADSVQREKKLFTAVSPLALLCQVQTTYQSHRHTPVIRAKGFQHVRSNVDSHTKGDVRQHKEDRGHHQYFASSVLHCADGRALLDQEKVMGPPGNYELRFSNG